MIATNLVQVAINCVLVVEAVFILFDLRYRNLIYKCHYYTVMKEMKGITFSYIICSLRKKGWTDCFSANGNLDLCYSLTRSLRLVF